MLTPAMVNVQQKVRRDPIRITFELLKATLKDEGISKTQLVRRANLNFRSIEHYLKRLQAGRFVRLEIVEGNWNRYYVTGEGEHLFKVLDELYELIDN